MSGTRNSRMSLHANSPTSQTSTSASPRTRGVTRRVLVPAISGVSQRTTSTPSTSGSNGMTTRSSLNRISSTVSTATSSLATRRASSTPVRTARPRATVAPVRLGAAAATARSPSSGTSVAGRPLAKRRLTLATQLPADATSIKRTKEPKNKVITVIEEEEEVIAVTKRASYTPHMLCPICMIDLGNTGSSTVQDNIPTSIGNCGHVICYACATRIYTLFARCPLCNEKINPSNFRKLYFS